MKISYNDSNIMTECFSFHNRVETSEIDTAYYYDKTGMTGWFDYSNDISVKKVSALSYFITKGKEKVKYVGSYVLRPSTLKFYVMIGEDVYTKEVTCPYAGFVSVKIDEEPEVDGQFIVSVDYPDYLPLEAEVPGYNEPNLTTFELQPQKVQLNDNPEQEYKVGTDSPSASFKDMNLCLKAYTQKVSVPTESAGSENEYEKPVIDGKLNAAIWDTASEIAIHTTDGTPIENLTSSDDINLKGLYIFVVRYSDGVTKRSLEMLY